jgi:hypothetical protein
VEQRSQVNLPPHVSPPFEVFVNGVPQVEGTDYELIGSSIVFHRSFAREGRLGVVRWASMFLGIAGTYRQNDTIDVVYSNNGQRIVASLRPTVWEGEEPS